MGTVLLHDDAALRMHPVDGAEHLRLIAVQGELRGASSRWSDLVRGAVEQRAEGIAVDLRGCHGIDSQSVQSLLAAAAVIKARGGSGVALVTMPGSKLDRRLRLLVGGELTVGDSADAAARALGDRRMPVPALVMLTHESEAVIVSVNGEIDRAAQEEFDAKLDEALALEPSPLIVDLEHCSFIDSTGIGLLVRACRRAAERKFALVACGPQVQRVLDLVGLPDFVPTYDTRLDALGALAT